MDYDYEEKDYKDDGAPVGQVGIDPENFNMSLAAEQWKSLERNRNFTSFAEFAIHIKQLHFVYKDKKNKGRPPEYRWECTCRWFLKRHICCHSLGMACKEEGYVIGSRIVRLAIKLEKKKGVGAPKKTKRALERQSPIVDIPAKKDKRKQIFCQCRKSCQGGKRGKPCTCFVNQRDCTTQCKCVCNEE